MNTTMAVKPHSVAWKPLLILSRPRLGPTVRSSMISIGAASEPARMRSDRSRVSFGVNAPVIWKRLPNSLWVVATEMGSPLPFSKRMMAIRCFTFSRVNWRMVRAARIIELHRDRRPLVLVEGGGSADELVAGHIDLLLDRHLPNGAVAPALGEYVIAEGGTGAHRLLVHQPYFERRRAAENFLRARSVLHARELHHDAIGALLLDHRLGHAELIPEPVQRRDILLQRSPQ